MAVLFRSLARVTCRLEFRYASPEVAEKVLKAVERENAPFMAARVEGDTLVSEAEARSLGSLVRTLEDYLANLSVAEQVLDLV